MSVLLQTYGTEFEEKQARSIRFSPVLFLALIFWVSCALVYVYAREVLEGILFVAGLAFLVASASTCLLGKNYLNKKKHLTQLLLIISLIAAGCLCALSGAFNVKCAQTEFKSINGAPKVSQSQMECTLFALNDMQEGVYGGELDCMAFLPNGKREKVRILMKNDEEVYYGQSFKAVVSFALPSETQKESFWMKGIVAKGSVKTTLSAKWITPFAEKRAAFIKLIRQQDNASADLGLLLALACGYRPLLQETSLYTDFQIAGLAHIVAVSGAHLSLAIACITALLSRTHMKRKTRLVAIVSVTVLFLFVCAFPISAFRAACMTCMACCSFLAGRRASSQNALGVCIFVCLLSDPSCSVSVSFALSALSTLGIIVLVPLMGKLFPSHKKKGFTGSIIDFVRENSFLTLAASVATLPLSAALFAQVSLIAPFSNILAGVLFTPLCLMSLACLLVFLASSHLPFALFVCCQKLCVLLSCIVGVLSRVPYAAIPVQTSVAVAIGTSTLIIAGILFAQAALHKSKRNKIEQCWEARGQHLQRNKRLAPAFIIACFVCGIFIAGTFLSPVILEESIYLAALDVGQGDALLLRDEKAAVLVDTGNYDTQLKRKLASKGVYHLDAVFITHPDNDHCGSLESLLRAVEVDAVYVPQDLLSCNCQKCTQLRSVAEKESVVLEGVAAGETFTTKHYVIQTIWPYNYADGGGNQDSLCLGISVDINNDKVIDYSALLVGDAESETLDRLIATNRLPKADIFKVGHHGSAASCTKPVLDAIAPSVALLSVGEKNRYGHPTETTLSLLEEENISIARTDTQGTITCFFKKAGICLATER